MEPSLICCQPGQEREGKIIKGFYQTQGMKGQPNSSMLPLAFRIKSKILNKMYKGIHLTSSHLCISPPTPLIPSIYAFVVHAPATQAFFQVFECIKPAPYCLRSLTCCSLLPEMLFSLSLLGLFLLSFQISTQFSLLQGSLP